MFFFLIQERESSRRERKIEEDLFPSFVHPEDRFNIIFGRRRFVSAAHLFSSMASEMDRYIYIYVRVRRIDADICRGRQLKGRG